MRRFLVAAACVFLALGTSACHKKKHKKGAVEEVPTSAKHKVEEYVKVEVDDSGFHPDKVYANKGEPITITFKRTDEKCCGTAVLIAEENIRKDLPVDKDVQLVYLPGHTGSVHFACPDNSQGGEIIVQ